MLILLLHLLWLLRRLLAALLLLVVWNRANARAKVHRGVHRLLAIFLQKSVRRRLRLLRHPELLKITILDLRSNLPNWKFQRGGAHRIDILAPFTFAATQRIGILIHCSYLKSLLGKRDNALVFLHYVAIWRTALL